MLTSRNNSKEANFYNSRYKFIYVEYNFRDNFSPIADALLIFYTKYKPQIRVLNNTFFTTD